MTYLKVTVGQAQGRAVLLEDEAPKICGLVKRFSPLEGLLSHAKICDNEVFFQVPFFSDDQENIMPPQAGDIGYWAVRQTVCFWYDQMEPLGPTIIFARIVENLPGLAEEGRRTWRRQGTKIRLELEG